MTNVMDDSEKEFTYVYQPPYGGPPQTGFEINTPSYIGYALLGIMSLIMYGYIVIIKKEEK